MTKIEVTQKYSVVPGSPQNSGDVDSSHRMAYVSFDALTLGYSARVNLAMGACLNDAMRALEYSNILGSFQLYVVVLGNLGKDNRVTRHKSVWGSLPDLLRQRLEGKSVGTGEIICPFGNIRYYALCKIDFGDLLTLTLGREAAFIAFLAPPSVEYDAIKVESENAIAEDIRKHSTDRWEATSAKGVKAGYLVLLPSFFEELHSVGVDVFYDSERIQFM